MNILIADPDVDSRRALREALACASDAIVVAECDDSREIMSACASHGVNVIFVDAALPQLSEFYRIYAALDDKPAYLVGMAPDEAAAMHALDSGVADFLLKPVTPGGVKRTFIRMRYLTSGNSPKLPAPQAGQLHESEFNHMLHSVAEYVFGRRHLHESGKLAVKVGTRIRLLKLIHIMYARAAGDYVDITLSTGERIHTKNQLVNLMSRLPAPQFVRTHRSFILNREFVKEIRAKNNDYELVLTDDTVITSGSTYRKQIRQEFLLNAV